VKKEVEDLRLPHTFEGGDFKSSGYDIGETTYVHPSTIQYYVGDKFNYKGIHGVTL
jgi:hypothetical protein